MLVGWWQWFQRCARRSNLNLCHPFPKCTKAYITDWYFERVRAQNPSGNVSAFVCSMPSKSSPTHPTIQTVPNSVAAQDPSHLSTQSEKSWRKISDIRMVSGMFSGCWFAPELPPPRGARPWLKWHKCRKKDELLCNDYVVYDTFIMKPCASNIYFSVSVLCWSHELHRESCPWVFRINSNVTIFQPRFREHIFFQKTKNLIKKWPFAEKPKSARNPSNSQYNFR